MQTSELSFSTTWNLRIQANVCIVSACVCLLFWIDSGYTSCAHILCSYSIAIFIIGKSHGNSVMSFLEMNKLMLDSWKAVDNHSRR